VSKAASTTPGTKSFRFSEPLVCHQIGGKLLLQQTIHPTIPGYIRVVKQFAEYLGGRTKINFRASRSRATVAHAALSGLNKLLTFWQKSLRGLSAFRFLMWERNLSHTLQVHRGLAQ
jgi:hypothetical protein